MITIKGKTISSCLATAKRMHFKKAPVVAVQNKHGARIVFASTK